MKVQRLVMHSFGNQREKIIDFSDGVNLIMGSDITTLNTVRAFIDGMLFGLSAENKLAYRPKRGGFSGSIYLEDESGTSLRVDRDFITDQYSVINSDGDDVTADFSDEYGNLALLPSSDSVFAEETIEFPDVNEKSLGRLAELKEKRRAHIEKNNYEVMLKEREALLDDIDAQRAIEMRLEENTAEISRRELKISELNDHEGIEFIEIDRNIAALEADNTELSAKIVELEVQQSLKRGDKENVLRRDIQSADDQLGLIERRIFELGGEEETYVKKLKTLEESFTIDRDELRSDYEFYRDELRRERGENMEPLVDRMTRIRKWVYFFLILLGVAGIGIALYNPVDVLGRAIIFVICFFSVFMILLSSFALYLQFNQTQVLALAEGIPDSSTYDRSGVEEILGKYNQKTPEDFNAFYNSAKKIYLKIDSLKSDLTNIRREIGQAETERTKILFEKEKTTQDLAADNRETDKALDEQVEKLKREQKANNARIDELKEERKRLSASSVWKLKEESMQLEETNAELKRLVSGNDKMLEDFNKLQRKIDRYESVLNDYDSEIAEIEDSLQLSKENFYLSYARPERGDYNLKMAKQFGFGLQNNLDSGIELPYITLDPFAVAGTEDDRLIEKLKGYIEDKQVLIFSSSLEEQIVLTKHKIKHNGIFIANKKVG